jgi:GNAT superfamily N-acetyltransferase
LTLRRAALEDMSALATLFRHVMRTSLSFLPELHTPAEDLAFFHDRLFAANEMWLAQEAGAIVGFIAFHEGFLDHLHVHPDHQGKGLGQELLARAKAANAVLELWTFQENARARSFYEARGFAAVQFTDGAANEERRPDVRYRWTAGPVGVTKDFAPRG